MSNKTHDMFPLHIYIYIYILYLSKKRKTASPIIGKSGIAVSTSLPEGGGGAEHAAADRRKKVSSASGISVNLFKAAMGGLKK
jgi:hypothetical protein